MSQISVDYHLHLDGDEQHYRDGNVEAPLSQWGFRSVASSRGFANRRRRSLSSVPLNTLHHQNHQRTSIMRDVEMNERPRSVSDGATKIGFHGDYLFAPELKLNGDEIALPRYLLLHPRSPSRRRRRQGVFLLQCTSCVSCRGRAASAAAATRSCH